jgi:hypothetical protein
MPSARRQKPKPKSAARRAPAGRSTASKKSARPAPRPSSARSPPKSRPGASKSSAPAGAEVAPASIPVVRRSDGRAHVLSLSFVRDGDEFLARMESDAGQITELKNRSLDQLLTLVASELEDLLE